MGSVKNWWMEQQELQPMHDWIEDHFGDDIDPGNEDDWNSAVEAYNNHVAEIEAREAYEHAADEYDYYIYLKVNDADEKFSTEFDNLLSFVRDNSADTSIVYKMCYAHAVTIFEVYMEDLTKSLLTNDDGFLNQYLKNSKVISTKQFSARDLLFNMESVQSEITTENIKKNVLSVLSDIIYHDIRKVINIFECLLGRDLNLDSKGINKVVHIRHDIVHRNAVNKSGVAHTISRDSVIEAMFEIKKFSDSIRHELSLLPR